MTNDMLMGLFPVVFMLHEFEEIIMLKPWLAKNGPAMERRFPVVAAKVLPLYNSLSTSAFTLAVLEEFFILTAVTYAAIAFGLHDLWAGLLIAFLFHLLVHIGQTILWRGYCPFIITSLLALPYCLYALFTLARSGAISPGPTAAWSIAAMVLVYLNLWLALDLARRFEAWTGRAFAPVADDGSPPA
ncbi:MAG: HXXEE domain-containing protein [Rhizobiaceae bacterium]|nr:HXXEE domain-containing protein [Rhizobiaceae bacterium]